MTFIQAGVPALLAVSSMLVNQQYIYNKVSLNRNTLKIRLCIELWPEVFEEFCISPRSNDSVFANLVLATTLQNITPVNKKNKLLFIKGRTWQKLRMCRVWSWKGLLCPPRNVDFKMLLICYWLEDCGLGKALYHLGPWYYPSYLAQMHHPQERLLPPLSPSHAVPWLRAALTRENPGSHKLSNSHSESQKKQVKLNLVMYS